LGPSLRASLLKSSSPKHPTMPHSRIDSHSGFIPTPLVPANSPFLTPANSFPDISLLENCENTSIIASASLLRVLSAYPSSYPSSPSTPCFDLSFTSDSDEDTEGIHLSHPTSISFDHDLAQEGVPKGVGLGIMGLGQHDGSGEFDGVGLVSIHRWMPRSARVTHEANTRVVPFQLSEPYLEDLYDDGGLELSDTFLQEAAMTFIQDPFHDHSLATIPECQSPSELDFEGDPDTADKDESPGSQALPASSHVSNSENEASLVRTGKHFSASTISSELKRTSASTFTKLMNAGGRRTISDTWPSHARSWPHQVKSGAGI